MAEILEFNLSDSNPHDPSNSNPHDPGDPIPHGNIEAMNHCLMFYNNLGYKDRLIVGTALLFPLPIDNVKDLESNPRTDFMKAYYELSDHEQLIVSTTILCSPPNVNIVLGIGVPPGLFGEE